MRVWKFRFSKDGVSLLILLSLLAFLLSSSCAEEGDKSGEKDVTSTKEIVLGALLPMSGDFDFFGKDALKGIELARKDLQKKGGIKLGEDNYQLGYEVLDTQGDPERTVGLVQKLINSGRAVGIIGPIMSSLAIPAAGICENAGFPMITPSATNPEVTRGKTGVFRGCFTDDYQGEAIASFLREEMGIKTAIVPLRCFQRVQSIYGRILCSRV